MTATILQRIYNLADAQHDGLCSTLASVCRKLAGDDDAAEKAHTIAGLIKKLEPAEQERVIAAVEGLRK